MLTGSGRKKAMAITQIQSIDGYDDSADDEVSSSELLAIVRQQRAEIDSLKSRLGASSAPPTHRARLSIGMPRLPRFALTLALALAAVCGGSAALASTNASRFDRGCFHSASGPASSSTCQPGHVQVGG
jgi:hypothetical protein